MLAQEADLLAAVYADPDADAPRLVYADWLLERDDPRGELIALQFKQHRGEILKRSEAGQAKKLIAKHQRAWLGALYKVTRPDKNVFKRGFLDSCCFCSKGAMERAVIGNPLWSTVREMEDWTFGSDAFTRTLASPVLRNLRVLGGCTGSLLGQLVTRKDLCLDSLDLQFKVVGGRASREARHVVDKKATTELAGWESFLSGGLPTLTSLAIYYSTGSSMVKLTEPMFVALLNSPRGRSLGQLTIRDGRSDPLRTARLFADLASKHAPPSPWNLSMSVVDSLPQTQGGDPSHYHLERGKSGRYTVKRR
jgi:uncharacterized protein (TIGR02996 family)